MKVTWNHIRKWYENNGFFDVARNMEEIKYQWEGREGELLSKLENYKF